MPDLLVNLKVNFPLRFGAQKGQPESQNRSQHTEVEVVVSVLAILRFGHPFWGHNRPLKIKAKRSNKYHQFWSESLHKTLETPQHFGFVPVQRKEEDDFPSLLCASTYRICMRIILDLFGKFSSTE